METAQNCLTSTGVFALRSMTSICPAEGEQCSFERLGWALSDGAVIDMDLCIGIYSDYPLVMTNIAMETGN